MLEKLGPEPPADHADKPAWERKMWAEVETVIRGGGETKYQLDSVLIYALARKFGQEKIESVYNLRDKKIYQRVNMEINKASSEKVGGALILLRRIRAVNPNNVVNNDPLSYVSEKKSNPRNDDITNPNSPAYDLGEELASQRRKADPNCQRLHCGGRGKRWEPTTSEKNGHWVPCECTGAVNE
jgi:hypothetical protein